ncbi:MAG: hypothetical protein U5Q44_08100 [Dehalococcoidia bacterium]|nr:hypothetical protein [Dehalococcoidia bacterium]
MDVLNDLSQVVLGEHPDRHIEASHDVLFLKNELIETFTRLAASRAAHEASRDGGTTVVEPYVSPRTKAASRDVLNASALLHHRSEVSREDLPALRYVLTTIPGNDRAISNSMQDLFSEALDITLQSYSEPDLETVRELTTIAQTFHWWMHGTPLEAQRHHNGLARIFFSLIGKTSWHEVNYDTFVHALQGREILNPRVNALREEILEDILEYTGHAD